MADSQTPVARANRARNASVRQIIEENKDRYETILTEQRTALGLPADNSAEKKKKQIEKYHAKLKELGVTVTLDQLLEAQQQG